MPLVVPTNGPSYNPDNVRVGQAAVFYQPYDPAAVMPQLDAPLWTPWPTPWVGIGATEEGVTLAFTRDTEQIMIEESEVAVDETTTSAEFNINAVLSEDTLETWLLAFGGGTITEVPAAGTGPTAVPEHRKLKISRDMTDLTIGFETKASATHVRRMLIPKAKSIADAEITFRRADDARRVEVSIKSLCSVEDIDIVESEIV